MIFCMFTSLAIHKGIHTEGPVMENEILETALKDCDVRADEHRLFELLALQRNISAQQREISRFLSGRALTPYLLQNHKVFNILV